MSDPLVLDPLLADRYSNTPSTPLPAGDPYAPQFNYVPVNYDPFSNPGVNYLGGGLAWMGGNRPAASQQETTQRLRSYGLPGTWNELYTDLGPGNIEEGTKQMAEGNYLPGFGQAAYGAISAATLGAAPIVGPYAKYAEKVGGPIAREGGNLLRGLISDEAGTFLGGRARYANLDDLARARKLVDRGLDPEGVRRATGWFEGPGGHWQYELSDANAKVNPSAFLQVYQEGEKSRVPITSYLQHPEFYRNYPGTFDKMTIRTDPSYKGTNIHAAHDAKENAIFLNPDIDPSYIRSALLHEITHPTQDIEGFPRGGSSVEFLPPDFKQRVEGTIDAYKGFITDLKSRPNATLTPVEEHLLAQTIRGVYNLPETELEKMLGKDLAAKALDLRSKFGDVKRAQENASESYHNLAGESQARLVQQRKDLSPYQISKFNPMDTNPNSLFSNYAYDVKPEDMIFKYGPIP